MSPQSISESLRNRLGTAVTVGYGPRFLHSTGSCTKAARTLCWFCKLSISLSDDVPVPETDYTFGALIEAQRLGDFTALKQRRRRALRINWAVTRNRIATFRRSAAVIGSDLSPHVFVVA